ncbi:MAG: tetratricopeptide repeat protein, partial [Planctomycetota bacterium]
MFGLLVFAITALGGLPGCADDETSGGAAASASIRSLDLEGTEAAVRDKIMRARSIVEADPGSAAAWGHLGVVLDAHGLDPEAVVCYQRAGGLDPDDFVAPYLMALVLAADNPSEALDAFERAITLRPDSAVMRFRYADALLRLGRESDARAQYEAALAIDGDSRKALLGLGELALRRGALEEARGPLLRAAQLEFYDREVHSKLARLYRRLGEPQRAEHEALLVRAYPDPAPIADSVGALVAREAVSSKARTDRGLTHVARRQYAEAEREFRLAIEQQPDSVRSHLNLAGVYIRQGRRTEAGQLFRQTLLLAPDDPEVHSNLAVALIDNGQLQQAREHLQTALRLDPRHDGAHYNLGLVHEREG